MSVDHDYVRVFHEGYEHGEKGLANKLNAVIEEMLHEEASSRKIVYAVSHIIEMVLNGD